MFRRGSNFLWCLGLVIFSNAAEAQPAAETRVFANPTVKGVRLDWCRNAGRECGKPAADLFCREQRLGEAIRFERDANVGARGGTTLVFGDGRICRGTACSGFRAIVCSKTAVAGTARPVAPSAAPSPIEPPRSAATPQTAAPPPRQATPPKPPEQSPPRVGVTPFGPIAPPLPAGARLFYCSSGSCDFQLTNNIDIDPKASTATQWFSWDVTKIAAAGAVRWQVASRPFPAFSAAQADLEPTGLVASEEGAGQQGSFEVDFKKVAGSARAAPDNLYVRVLPLARQGATMAAGQPSNIIKVHYGASPPSQSSSPFIGQNVTAYNLELVRFEYRPYQLIERWPPGCKDIPTNERRSDLEAAAHALEEAWNFASEAYQWVKARAVDLASTLTAGLIPREYLEVALDGALVAVGIPPDVPNFSELMRSGVDGLAKEVAKGVVSQLPAGQLAPTLGNLGADIAVSEAEKLTTDELKQRLTREIEKRSREALLAAAVAAEAQLASDGPNMYCRLKAVPPTYRGVVRNAGSTVANDVKIVVSDSKTLFQATTVTLDIGVGKSANWTFAPKPLIRVVQRSELVQKDASANDQNWWNELYAKVPTRLAVSGLSQRQCPPGTANPALCQESIRSLHQSAGERLLTQSYNFSKPQPSSPGAKSGDGRDDANEKKGRIDRKKNR